MKGPPPIIFKFQNHETYCKNHSHSAPAARALRMRAAFDIRPQGRERGIRHARSAVRATTHYQGDCRKRHRRREHLHILRHRRAEAAHIRLGSFAQNRHRTGAIQHIRSSEHTSGYGGFIPHEAPVICHNRPDGRRDADNDRVGHLHHRRIGTGIADLPEAPCREDRLQHRGRPGRRRHRDLVRTVMLHTRQGVPDNGSHGTDRTRIRIPRLRDPQIPRREPARKRDILYAHKPSGRRIFHSLAGSEEPRQSSEVRILSLHPRPKRREQGRGLRSLPWEQHDHEFRRAAQRGAHLQHHDPQRQRNRHPHHKLPLRVLQLMAPESLLHTG